MSHNHHNHVDTTTASPHEGHNMGGHDMGGHDMGGHDMGGHNMSGHDMGGHDMSGHDMGGHDMGGHDMGGHDMGGMDHSGMNHMMSMSFHYGTKETVLFDFWSFCTANGLIASVLGIFLLGILYEGLKYYREYLYWKYYNSVQYGGACHKLNPADCDPADPEEDAKKQKRFGTVHLYQTILHFVQVNLSYCLMLIFMTYNVYLGVAVALGSATGFLLFGWRRAIPVDLSERSDYPLRIKEVDNTEQNAPFQNPA